MRKLHLVGLTTDHDGLIFTARKGSKSGGYIVPLDAKVLAAVAEASRANGGPSAEVPAVEREAVPKRLRSESALTPREMQARLRAGRSIEEVAAEAGVDNEWVARFAVPILAEQAQVVELARALVYAKPRLGESSQPLGVSVMQNLSDRGVFLPDDVAHAGWSAFQLHDSVWMVRFRYRARARDQEAQWEIDVPTGRLRARNRHASDLGYVDPARWRTAGTLDEGPADDEEVVAVAPARRSARTAAGPQPMAKAVAAAKRRTATTPPVAGRAGSAGRAAGRTPATARKAAPPAAAKRAGAAPAAARSTKRARPPATAKATSGSKATAGKSPTRRRPARAVPAPDAGPTPGSGGVRMAVARVSTARVAASLAAADREPWAAAVRRTPRADSRSPDGSRADGGHVTSRPVGPEPASPQRRREPAPVRAFEPRPLPPPGQEPEVARVRKVTIPRPVVPADGPPAVSLPAPRRKAPRQEPMQPERPPRRRLRSR